MCLRAPRGVAGVMGGWVGGGGGGWAVGGLDCGRGIRTHPAGLLWNERRVWPVTSQRPHNDDPAPGTPPVAAVLSRLLSGLLVPSCGPPVPARPGGSLRCPATPWVGRALCTAILRGCRCVRSRMRAVDGGTLQYARQEAGGSARREPVSRRGEPSGRRRGQRRPARNCLEVGARGCAARVRVRVVGCAAAPDRPRRWPLAQPTALAMGQHPTQRSAQGAPRGLATYKSPIAMA